MNRRGFLSFFAAAPLAAPVLAAGALASPPPAMVGTRGAEIFRDHAIDGNPGSGQHLPSKAEIREWATAIEQALEERGFIEPQLARRERLGRC